MTHSGRLTRRTTYLALEEWKAFRICWLNSRLLRCLSLPLNFLKVYGVSTRFVRGIVNRFREDVVSELNDIALSSDAHASEGKQSGGSGSSSRKSRGKQRKRGGSKKADSHVSVNVGDGDQFSIPINMKETFVIPRQNVVAFALPPPVVAVSSIKSRTMTAGAVRDVTFSTPMGAISGDSRDVWTIIQLSLFAVPSFPLLGNVSQGDLVSDAEAQSFLRACKPELDDFLHLVAALGAHLAPTFREAKIDAIRRAEEVSQSMRCKLANFPLVARLPPRSWFVRTP